MARAVVELQGCTRDFGAVRAVDALDLAVHEGELLSLLGPSGCGKTTTLNLIAGFVAPSAGRVFVDGQDVTARPPHERGLGVVFQSYALFPHMSVFENVAFGLRERRVAESEIGRRVGEALALVRLQGQGERRPRQLSGGMQQRAALARALVYAPRVLLLDEPFGALDAQVRQELRRWLRRLHADIHLTSVFVTHDQEEALEVGDRVVLMNSGRVEQVGSPQDVWDHPASPFVYGFLGDVNLFHGRSHEGEVTVEGMQLDGAENRGLRDGRALAYVRPHDLDVKRYVPETFGSGAPRPQGIVATLSRAIVVGPIARLELEPVESNPDNPGSGTIIEAQLPAQQFRELGLREGDTVVATPRKARVFVEDWVSP